jgi:hypothetical protein
MAGCAVSIVCLAYEPKASGPPLSVDVVVHRPGRTSVLPRVAEPLQRGGAPPRHRAPPRVQLVTPLRPQPACLGSHRDRNAGASGHLACSRSHRVDRDRLKGRSQRPDRVRCARAVPGGLDCVEAFPAPFEPRSDVTSSAWVGRASAVVTVNVALPTSRASATGRREWRWSTTARTSGPRQPTGRRFIRDAAGIPPDAPVIPYQDPCPRAGGSSS